jgi:hypothetical protein
MKLYTKLLISALFVTTLTSCTTYKTIASKEQINEVFLSQLKTNKKHKFYLTSGIVLKVHIDSIDTERIYGRMPQPSDGQTRPGKIGFSDSIESLNKNVNKISRKKFNPYLSLAAVAVPVGTLIIIGMNMTYDVGF